MRKFLIVSLNAPGAVSCAGIPGSRRCRSHHRLRLRPPAILLVSDILLVGLALESLDRRHRLPWTDLPSGRRWVGGRQAALRRPDHHRSVRCY